MRSVSSQNFLVCDDVVDKVLELATHGPKQVTELGVGQGVITKPLAKSGFSVRGIEKDETLQKYLTPSPSPPRGEGGMELVWGDLREVDWAWEGDWQLVGNIPYHVSGLILRKLTQFENSPKQAILIVQHEVAQRLCEVTSLLGLSIALWGEAEFVQTIPADCFDPKPKVDSGLVRLVSNPSSLLSDREKILQVARPYFQQRRKQMGSVLEKIHLDPRMRPEELTAEQWIQLTKSLGAP